jgi:hypothetical protein
VIHPIIISYEKCFVASKRFPAIILGWNHMATTKQFIPELLARKCLAITMHFLGQYFWQESQPIIIARIAW